MIESEISECTAHNICSNVFFFNFGNYSMNMDRIFNSWNEKWFFSSSDWFYVVGSLENRKIFIWRTTPNVNSRINIQHFYFQFLLKWTTNVICTPIDNDSAATIINYDYQIEKDGYFFTWVFEFFQLIVWIEYIQIFTLLLFSHFGDVSRFYYGFIKTQY